MSELTDLLLQGPRSAPELRQRLAISQATFSRLVAREDRVIRFGKARATRYALLRPYRGIERIPVWRVDDTGKAHKFADIRLCWPQGSCLVTGADGDEQWFDGLPWYLTDLRPQGFLGRAWGRKLAAQLNLTDDIRLWQEEDVLYALTVFNGEYTGGWLVGEGNYQRWITAQHPAEIPLDQKLTHYEQLASDALAGEIVGSSAGGEQPKFTCYAQTPSGNKHVLVKFTVPQQTAVSQRWGDLLIAESIAAQILRDSTYRCDELKSKRNALTAKVTMVACLLCRWRRCRVSLSLLRDRGRRQCAVCVSNNLSLTRAWRKQK